jgi:hypothetical protein
VESLSLPGFVNCAKYLEKHGSKEEFVRFVLTGVLDNRQYSVDAIKDALPPDHRVQSFRDYDSVLGLHDTICVDTYLTMFPVSRHEDTLRRNVHIKISFANEFVRPNFSY